jgi:peptidoglycan/LPS O-acetylase OafA/YrhL
VLVRFHQHQRSFYFEKPRVSPASGPAGVQPFMHSWHTQSSRPKSLNALTSLRFFAAVVIVLHHSKGSFGLDSEWLRNLPTEQAVSFFFVLSGFILTYVYQSLVSTKSIKGFLIARVARIWPLHIATLLLVVVLFPPYLRTPGGKDLPTVILTNVFMVQAWIPVYKYYLSYNSLSWAISTEFAFYLLFPLLLYHWNRTWHIKLLCAFLIAVVIIFYSNVINLPSGEAINTRGNVGYTGLLYIGPLGRLFEFTLGMTIALAYRKITPLFQPGRLLATVMELAALIMALGIMAMTPYIPRLISLDYSWIGWGSGIHWLAGGGLPCSFFGLLILVMALEKGLISRLLSWRILRSLGEMSLSIYLLHQILVRYYWWRFKDVIDLPNWLAYAYFWAILLIGSYFLLAVIERPCRKFIVGLGQRPHLPEKDRSTITKFDEGYIRLSFRRLLSTLGTGSTGKKRIIVTGGALLALLLPLFLYIQSPLTPTNAIEKALACKIAGNADPKYQNITFGNKFLLLGAHLVKSEDKITVQLVWESIEKQRLSYNVAVHVLDAGGQILSQADYVQNKANILVKAHTIWLEKTEIPKQKLEGATTLGIVIYSPDSTILSPDRGQRDWQGDRLLITLPDP